MWHVPVDHDIFNEISTAQWLWYFHNFMEDQNEEFVSRRNMVEYHASFIEPEAVRKIRESRDKAVEVSDDSFSAGLKHFFGRELNAQKREPGKIETADVATAMANYNAIKNKELLHNPNAFNHKHWLDTDLE